MKSSHAFPIENNTWYHGTQVGKSSSRNPEGLSFKQMTDMKLAHPRSLWVHEVLYLFSNISYRAGTVTYNHNCSNVAPCTWSATENQQRYSYPWKEDCQVGILCFPNFFKYFKNFADNLIYSFYNVSAGLHVETNNWLEPETVELVHRPSPTELYFSYLLLQQC